MEAVTGPLTDADYMNRARDHRARPLCDRHALPRTRIVKRTGDYLHAECRSQWLGFMDDLELHLRTAHGPSGSMKMRGCGCAVGRHGFSRSVGEAASPHILLP